jgi:hypothetical protein
MDRRHFFHMLWGAPTAIALNLEQWRSGPFDSPIAVRGKTGGDPPSKPKNPLHECVDRPHLPCPACNKADGFAEGPVERQKPSGKKKPGPNPRSN